MFTMKNQSFNDFRYIFVVHRVSVHFNSGSFVSNILCELCVCVCVCVQRFFQFINTFAYLLRTRCFRHCQHIHVIPVHYEAPSNSNTIDKHKIPDHNKRHVDCSIHVQASFLVQLLCDSGKENPCC